MTTFADRSTYYLIYASSPHLGTFSSTSRPSNIFLSVQILTFLAGILSNFLLWICMWSWPFFFSCRVRNLKSFCRLVTLKVITGAKGLARQLYPSSHTTVEKLSKTTANILSLSLPVSLDIFVVYFTPRVCTIHCVDFETFSCLHESWNSFLALFVYIVYCTKCTYHRFTVSIELNMAAHISILSRWFLTHLSSTIINIEYYSRFNIQT